MEAKSTLPGANVIRLSNSINGATNAHKRKPKSFQDFRTDCLNAFFEQLSSFSVIGINESEKSMIAEVLKVKLLKKKQYLTQEGEVCRHMHFVLRGSVRMYSRNFKGHEFIMEITLENNWVCDFESFCKSLPSNYYIQAIETSELLAITYESLERLSNEIPAISAMVKRLEQDSLIEIQKRMYAVLSLSAEDRYYQMLEQRPVLINRFSLTLIASYLGITSETLSRIRRLGLQRSAIRSNAEAYRYLQQNYSTR